MSAPETRPTVEELETVIANLRIALESRDVIGQAKGALMVIHGWEADEAFAALVKWSQSSPGMKLRDVAGEVLAQLCAGRTAPRELTV